MRREEKKRGEGRVVRGFALAGMWLRSGRPAHRCDIKVNGAVGIRMVRGRNSLTHLTSSRLCDEFQCGAMPRQAYTRMVKMVCMGQM
jgi:hypothetical protein